jgi:N-acetylglutamate synthase-like GNAT family acetyltransferase
MSMPDSPISIIPFAPEYADQVFDVILPIQHEFGIQITAADQPDLQNIPSYYQRDRGNFWVALHGQVVVGTVALLDIGDGQGALRKMFVRQAYRGGSHGVARRLLEALLAWARERAFREIYLGTTDKFLAAHRFYEKHGFQEIAKSDLPPAFPVMVVDSKFYRYAL